jgi:hypothetical protein
MTRIIWKKIREEVRLAVSPSPRRTLLVALSFGLIVEALGKMMS